MRKQNGKRQLAALVTTAACSLGVAHATVNYQIGNGGLGTFSGSIDGTSINGGLAGGINMTEQGGPVNGVPTSYVSVCTDLEGTLYLGQTYTYNTPVTPFGSQVTGLQPTWGAVNTPSYLSGNSVNTANAGQAIQNAAYIFYNYGTAGSTLTGNGGISGTTDQLEALQLAVWAALYDTTTDGSVSLTGGRFTLVKNSVDSTVWNDVMNWLGLNGSALTGNYNYNGYLFQPTSGAPNNRNADGQLPQELLYGVTPGSPQGGPTPLPEPSTIVAGLFLLLPMAGSVWKIARSRRNAELATTPR
jgi:hypothetical protein